MQWDLLSKDLTETYEIILPSLCVRKMFANVATTDFSGLQVFLGYRLLESLSDLDTHHTVMISDKELAIG